MELSVNTVAFISTADESHNVGRQLQLHPFSLSSVCSSNIYRHESGRCCSLPFFLLYIFNDKINDPMAQQPIEAQHLPTDCCDIISLPADRGEELSSQFSDDIWSVSHTTSYYGLFKIILQQLPKFLMMLGWQ